MWPIISIAFAVVLSGASGFVLGSFATYFWLVRWDYPNWEQPPYWDNESGNE